MLDHKEVQSCAHQALELLPPEYFYMRGFAMIMEAAALQMTGRYPDALSVLKSAQADPLLQQKHTQGVLLAGLSPICMMEADEYTLRTVATRLLKLGNEAGLPAYRSWGRMYLASSHYQRNEIEDAVRTLTSHLEDRYFMYPDVVIDGAVILSLCYQVLGQPQEARDAADLLSQHAVETGHQGLLLAEQAFQAELALRQGRLDNAIAWARVFEPRKLQAHYFFYLPELTHAKVLITENTSASIQKAQNQLLDIEKFARATNNNSILIPALALQAILLDKNDQSEALEKAAESISLAKPGGGMRFFLDLGLPMENLLIRLLEQKSAKKFIEKLLAAFSEEKQRASVQSPDGVTHKTPLLEDPLTVREQEILNQLSQGKTNKEIAENLFISIDTVKTHLKKIFQKLDVNSRLQAVTQANALGIVTVENVDTNNR
jgi:LuxR family maltose regulon positive regulatory protein